MITTRHEQKLSTRPDNNHLAHILDEHGITRKMTKTGTLIARDEWVSHGQLNWRWINVSGWTFRQLFAWLGY